MHIHYSFTSISQSDLCIVYRGIFFYDDVICVGEVEYIDQRGLLPLHVPALHAHARQGDRDTHRQPVTRYWSQNTFSVKWFAILKSFFPCVSHTYACIIFLYIYIYYIYYKIFGCFFLYLDDISGSHVWYITRPMFMLIGHGWHVAVPLLCVLQDKELYQHLPK